MRFGQKRLVTLIILLLTLLLVACTRPLSPEQLAEKLQRKLSELESYQLVFVLESSGQVYTVTQWYKAPDSVRTDVAQSDQPLYRFIFSRGRLLLAHLPTGQTQELVLNENNQLFTAPLLSLIAEEAIRGQWSLEEDSGCYHGSFCWQEETGAKQAADLWVDGKSLLPTEIQLATGAGQVVSLVIKTVVTNPPLDQALFFIQQ